MSNEQFQFEINDRIDLLGRLGAVVAIDREAAYPYLVRRGEGRNRLRPVGG